MLILASEKLPYSTWDGKNPPAPLPRQPNAPPPSPELLQELEGIIERFHAMAAEESRPTSQPESPAEVQSLPDKAA